MAAGYDTSFFKNPGRKFTEFFTGKNEFVMILEFKKSGGNIYENIDK